MGEPEDLLIEAARVATVTARDLWRRAAPTAGPPAVALARVRDRLELVVTGVFGRAFPIVPAEPPPAPTWLARLARRTPRHLKDDAPAAWTDGERIRLPPALDAGDGEAPAIARYRLLAVEQAARAARGTPGPLGRAGLGDLARDFYLLSEAVAVDRALAIGLPGLLPDLRRARAAALAARPSLEWLTPLEQAVERLVREALAAHPASPPAAIPVAGAPEASLEWAHATARRLGRDAPGYRGLPDVALWGRVLPAPPCPPDELSESGTPLDLRRPGSARAARLRRRPDVRPAAEDEDDERAWISIVRWDDPQESVEDPMRLVRPGDQDEGADPEGLADSLAELPAARAVRTPGLPREVLASEDPPSRARSGDRPAGEAAGVVYPEWDCRVGAYRTHGAVVRPAPAPEGEAGWAEAVLARHACLVRRVRRDFDALRPRRIRLGRQLDGPEVDLAAYVTAFADRRAGRTVDDRLYSAVRPARRDISIALLVDVSASTDSWVAGTRRIIDVEKESLVVIAEALNALGDRYAILAFSGEGPGHVSVLTLKGFAEPSGAAVRRRIAALEPDRYTRCGAAIRHATILLGREAARHRLLLVLSDGKPNDLDVYEGRYGVEDARQAVAEARLEGLHPFCLTVDARAAAYVPYVFGRSAYALLRHPERLPAVLVDVVRQLLRS